MSGKTPSVPHDETPGPADAALSVRGLESGRSWDYENGFYWFSHPSRLNKMLAHFELHKSIVGIRGTFSSSAFRRGRR